MPLDARHFHERLAPYERDPELHRELYEKFVQEQPAGAIVSIAESIAPTSPALVDAQGTATVHGAAVAETIVKANARPVLLIRNNAVTAEFLGPDSGVWRARIAGSADELNAAIPSVGRINLKNNPDFPWVGTGWVVDTDIVVTNRHVAREFARVGPGGFVFRLGLNNAPESARVDFLEEFQRAATLEFDIDSVLWIAEATDPDVAFLRLKPARGGRRLPTPIALATSVAADDFVAAIGYPARDPRVPDQDLVQRIFGDVYEKKRLAPGQIIEVEDDQLEHDCSTLGGNSGSALVSFRSGQAVGLHFSGLFMEANFAVPAPRIKELLGKVQRGELPTAVAGTPLPLTPLSAAPTAPSVSVSTPLLDGNTVRLDLRIPIEVALRIGGASGTLPALLRPRVDVSDSGRDEARALAAARVALAGDSEVLDVRLGYRFKNGWITNERVVVVELKEKMSPSDLATLGRGPLPTQFEGLGVDVRTGGMTAQLRALGIDVAELEAPAKGGLYREPKDLKLERVREPMEAVFHVSPDSGFPNLKAFIGRVKKHLTATIYEWEPTHISDAIEAAMEGAGKTLRMVTMPHFGIAEGTEAAVEDMEHRIGKKFEHVFASVGSGKLVPSAYHIKVATRDGEELWLSSGNWKESNQADIDPAGEHSTDPTPLHKHNREWHAIIKNAKLATLFQKYIEFDFAEAKRVPFEEAPFMALPDVFVPESAFAEKQARGGVQYFPPLEINRELDVEPLLTPDRYGERSHIFIRAATRMVAEARDRVFVENQSFSIATSQEEYEAFFNTLLEARKNGREVKIIFRDPREFPKGAANLQKALETIKEFGFDIDDVRVQRKCHTKGIVVDGKQVLLGSENLTTAGSLFNRDASLLVRDAEVAAYFEKVFRFDWDHVAVQEANEAVGGMRLAMPGEATPVGFRRMSVAELLGGD